MSSKMGRSVIVLVSFLYLYNVLDHKVVGSKTEVQERSYTPSLKVMMIIVIYTIALRSKCV